MAGYAIAGVDFFAAHLQLIQRPGFIGCVSNRRLFHIGFLTGNPRAVIGSGFHLNHNRHKTVILAAELRTLTTEDARLFSLEPGVANKARHGVLLHRQRWHPPGVNDVSRRHQHAHFFAHWNNDNGVGFEQVVFAFGFGTLDLRLRRRKAAVEADAFAFAPNVIVAPLPLVASGFDGQIRV